MNKLSWQIKTGIVLLLSTITLCFFHYIIFRKAFDLMFYLALDVVFVPAQVLLVTFIIGKLLDEREKMHIMKKLNMVIGAFFAEVGDDAVRKMRAFCADADTLEKAMLVDAQWGDKEYSAANKFGSESKFVFKPTVEDLRDLKAFLLDRRIFVLSLLQNPNLLEHDTFTDLIWAITHLTEELEARKNLDGLPETDLMHLGGDVLRAFVLLVREWLAYMQHLKTEYPYIYSLAIRANPFKREWSAVITK